MRRLWGYVSSLLRGMRIQQKMSLSFTLIFLLLLVIQMVVFSQFLSDIVRTRANDYILETLRQTGGKIDACIDTVNMISKNIVSNGEISGTVVRNLMSGQSGPLSYGDTEKINTELSKITLAYDGINSIQIYAPGFTVNYNFVSETDSYKNSLSPSDLSRLSASGGELVLLAARREYVDKITDKTIYVFSAVRKFFDFRTGRELGYVFVNINERVLRDIVSPVRIGTGGHIQIFSREGIVVSSEFSDEIGASVDTALLDRVAQGAPEGFYITPAQDIVVYSISDVTGWGTVTRLKMNEVTSEYDVLKRINIFIGLLGVVVAALVSLLVSKALTRPIKELLSTMRRIQEGDLTAKAKIKTNDEIGHLGQVFNQMTTEMQTLIEQYYHDKLSQQESELKAMQAQISPHFLYNSLDSVYWMLVVKGETDIAETLVALCEVLRYTVSRESGMVELDKELEMIGHYLAIQKARFGAKLTWENRVEPALRPLTVPKMILQPLVENAIVHGMDAQKSTLRVTIDAAIELDHLVVHVRDDGIGIAPDRLAQLHAPEASDVQAGHTGLGLETVNRRIQILFGEEYGLTLTSEIGAGTAARLTLPYIRQEASGRMLTQGSDSERAPPSVKTGPGQPTT